MSNAAFKAVSRAGALLLAGLVVGCATDSQTPKVMSPQFYGTWFEIGGVYWWDISASGANLYTESQKHECERMATRIVSPNRVVVIAMQDGSFNLRRDGEELLMTQTIGTTRLEPGTRSSICRSSTGKYIPGAPYSTDMR
jgi:hypothetical protein